MYLRNKFRIQILTLKQKLNSIESKLQLNETEIFFRFLFLKR